MTTILSIIVFALILTIIVSIHELGHFYFAKKANILCHEFAVGMGPAIYQKRKGETIYSLRAIPFGGYVAMAGEEIVDAYIAKDQNIGIRLDIATNEITHIILDNDLPKDLVGRVQSFDLMGKDLSELYIELMVNDEIIKYIVKRDAKYLFKKEKEVQISPEERLFDSKSLWQRFKVIFAGPLANLLLAFLLLFFVGFFIGKPNEKAIISDVSIEELNDGDLITHVSGSEINSYEDLTNAIRTNANNNIDVTVDGDVINLELIVVMQGLGFASTYGSDELIAGQVFGRSKELQAGDLITGILITNNKTTNINYFEPTTWNELINYVNDIEGQQIYLRYEREGKTLFDSFEGISQNALQKLGANAVQYVGGFSQDRNFNLLYPLYYPFMQMGSDIKGMFNTISLLINPNENVGVKDLAGPIGIFSLVDSTLKQGFISLVTFTAFLSINIAILNLMPIPALDGGRLVFLGIEAIIRRPINKKVENIIINITFILLLGLIIIVSYNDILRLFN